ncbi:hypothetical protein FBZ88_106108 [Nitrospirillum bahiense]|uniref:Uncharacterized protein n=1 Tax=Nitrospirillum amazonense TaxID=28077 RepID=A0A560G172_9PROT|nr:hypothetical protein FBZ88_106108 [Nitrospirillum amazonense]
MKPAIGGNEVLVMLYFPKDNPRQPRFPAA